MKKLLRMLVTCCLTFTAASIAQGTQQTPPSPTNPPEHSAPSMQQDSQPGSMASSMNKGDKIVKGCIRSNNGKYMLESKHHKMIWLTGAEDLAPHVGHTVTLHGSFLNTSSAASTMSADTGTVAGASSTGTSSAGQGSDFLVKQIVMVADRCTLESHKAMKEHRGSAPDQK